MRSVLGFAIPLAAVLVGAPLLIGLAMFQPVWLLLIPAALMVFGGAVVLGRRKTPPLG